jgi:hypothetical protein
MACDVGHARFWPCADVLCKGVDSFCVFSVGSGGTKHMLTVPYLLHCRSVHVAYDQVIRNCGPPSDSGLPLEPANSRPRHCRTPTRKLKGAYKQRVARPLRLNKIHEMKVKEPVKGHPIFDATNMNRHNKKASKCISYSKSRI